jgi:hypothetical protein
MIALEIYKAVLQWTVAVVKALARTMTGIVATLAMKASRKSESDISTPAKAYQRCFGCIQSPITRTQPSDSSAYSALHVLAKKGQVKISNFPQENGSHTAKDIGLCTNTRQAKPATVLFQCHCSRRHRSRCGNVWVYRC